MAGVDGRVGLLGIARRAGRVALGTRAVDRAARAGRLALLLVASDASRHALGRLAPEARAAPRLTLGSRAALGRILGRRSVAVAGVTDVALAARMLKWDHAAIGDDESSGPMRTRKGGCLD